ncbi:hypothetical protein [Microbispora rosea]|uniref:hypothetical protein n=1 Tax=Microbispora rosea TaxID=58117 RepID=UPI00068F2B4A|nr:hypothetical protein [Microbispora rosea]
MSHGCLDDGGEGDAEGETLGEAVGEAVGEVPGDGEVTPPVQVTPLRAKLDGAGLEPLNAPLNPKLVLPTGHTDAGRQQRGDGGGRQPQPPVEGADMSHRCFPNL